MRQCRFSHKVFTVFVLPDFIAFCLLLSVSCSCTVILWFLFYPKDKKKAIYFDGKMA